MGVVVWARGRGLWELPCCLFWSRVCDLTGLDFKFFLLPPHTRMLTQAFTQLTPNDQLFKPQSCTSAKKMSGAQCQTLPQVWLCPNSAAAFAEG